MGRGTSPKSDGLDVAELELGPGLPTLRIGSASKALVYFPGLSLHPGLPTGMERRMATSGWGALQAEYSVLRLLDAVLHCRRAFVATSAERVSG